jgi:hypothetical protein
MTLRTPIVTLFLVLYALALVRPAFPLVEYYLQYDAYLKACKNRDRPELLCNGQCVLSQKLLAAQGGDDQPTPPPPAKVDLQDYPIGFVSPACDIPVPETSIAFHQRHSASYFYDYADDIFHPPV